MIISIKLKSAFLISYCIADCRTPRINGQTVTLTTNRPHEVSSNNRRSDRRRRGHHSVTRQPVTRHQIIIRAQELNMGQLPTSGPASAAYFLSPHWSIDGGKEGRPN